jgi:hypothetical protein
MWPCRLIILQGVLVVIFPRAASWYFYLYLFRLGVILRLGIGVVRLEWISPVPVLLRNSFTSKVSRLHYRVVTNCKYQIISDNRLCDDYQSLHALHALQTLSAACSCVFGLFLIGTRL